MAQMISTIDSLDSVVKGAEGAHSLTLEVHTNQVKSAAN